MGIITDAYNRWRARKQEFKDMQGHRQMVRTVEERELSSEERELNDYYERDRQKEIKKLVKKRREGLKKELLYSNENNPIYAKNVMVGHKNLFGTPNIFASAPNQFNQKNIFVKKGGLKHGSNDRKER